MSLNDIQLSPSLTASLYRHSLVQPEANGQKPVQKEGLPATVATKSAVKTEEPSPNVSAWPSLGNNQQNILLVVNYGDTTHLPDEELDFLIKILSACQLSLADVAIINKNNYPDLSSKNILPYFNTEKAILLGVEPAEFGLAVSFPAYQLQQVGNARFFHAPSLSERNNDPLYKSKLWVCLKQLFGI